MVENVFIYLVLVLPSRSPEVFHLCSFARRMQTPYGRPQRDHVHQSRSTWSLTWLCLIWNKSWIIQLIKCINIIHFLNYYVFYIYCQTMYYTKNCVCFNTISSYKWREIFPFIKNQNILQIDWLSIHHKLYYQLQCHVIRINLKLIQ